MKRLALILLALIAVAQAQNSASAPLVSQQWTFNATGRGPTVYLGGIGVAWHRMTFIVQSGTVSALAFTLDTASDCATWSSGGAIPNTVNAVPPATMPSPTAAYAPCVSLNVTTLTGGGTVLARYEGYPAAGDPCKAWWTTKQFKAFNAVSAANKTIAGITGLDTWVCSVNVSITGTTPTIAFSSGTGTTCGTANVPITGTIAMTASQPICIGSGTVFGDAGIGRDFCITPAGTSPSASGNIVYVNQ